LSEIEGDALLFYKLGDPLPIRVVLGLFKQMSLAFRRKYQQLRLKYNVKASLSLKFILHYGDIQVYCLKGFEKLYGVTLVESHCLLKNGFAGSDYLLITEDYIQAVDKQEDSKSIITWDISKRTSQSFLNLREINYYFFDRLSKSSVHYDASSNTNVG
ncbi:MAG TPA: DUF2652 domain-containing protein, partial [Flavitalea sp.]|nr:DUF2652 domain-containing protein [Flavitalea sp.]